jgi:hypothetical protein
MRREKDISIQPDGKIFDRIKKHVFAIPALAAKLQLSGISLVACMA